MMTFIKILIVAIWKSRQVSGHTGGEICHFKLLNYLYLTIMWWERTQFSNSTFWRLVFSHSWFRIHLQLDFVSLEMNSEPLVWEHQSPKCFGGEPTIHVYIMLYTRVESIFAMVICDNYTISIIFHSKYRWGSNFRSTYMCARYIAIYHVVDFFWDISCHLDIRQHQQHGAFNRHLNGTK